jgi:hypothetical protein
MNKDDIADFGVIGLQINSHLNILRWLGGHYTYDNKVALEVFVKFAGEKFRE